MKQSIFFSKLKNQNGITGTDIVISISIIALIVTVITTIYINIDLTSKNVNRTAGATRIATNILENINKTYYEEFEKALNNFSTNSYITVEEDAVSERKTILVEPSKTSEQIKIFNTKIPKGYTLKLDVLNNYGSDTKNKFDLVKKIDITVKYDVGKKEENINVSTVKQYELAELVNNPSFEKDTQKFIEDDDDNSTEIRFIPVKKVGDNFIKTTENDNEWYMYENQKWAMALVEFYVPSSEETSNSSEAILKSSELENLYVWIPSFGKYTDTGEEKFAFKYKESKYTTKLVTLAPKISTGISKIIRTIDTEKTLSDYAECSFADTQSGFWIKYNDSENDYIKKINSSEYGPMEF